MCDIFFNPWKSLESCMARRKTGFEQHLHCFYVNHFWFDSIAYQNVTIMVMSVFLTTAAYSVMAKYYVAYNVCMLSTMV